ncbi:MAG: phosphatidate cytidylyltransferase [Burkholderiales bacterium]|nr:phosphatidate cytidylyltransferase [Burkholderiales bacterium]
MFVTRLITAAVALPAFVAALLWLPNKYWTIALLPLLLAGAWEWSRLVGYRSAGRWLFAGVVLLTALLVLVLAFYAGSLTAAFYLPPDAVIYGIAAGFWLGVAPAWLHGRWRTTAPLALGLAGWIVLVPTWLALSRLQVQPWHLLMVLGIVWIADSAAYVAGKRLGRRKLVPDISPGKTWEGVMGAVATVAVYYALLQFAGPPVWAGGFAGLCLFAALTALSIEGDLFESWMKRQAGVKDSGTLFPGHGGVLDRIDGLTASLPLAALVNAG